MATNTYYYKLDVDSSETSVTQMIQAGTKTIQFDFQWAVASEEQFNLVARYLTNKANTDPLYDDGEYDRSYDWYTYYMDLAGVDLDTWLDTNPILPHSIYGLTRSRQKSLLRLNITEAQSLQPAILLYTEVLKWQFTATVSGDTTVGYVQPGGWYRNQDNSYSFRFLSGQTRIGKEDLSNVYIVFEVYDE